MIWSCCIKCELSYEIPSHINQLNFHFISGMPFYQAVHILRKQDRIIKGVQVWYSDQVSRLIIIFTHTFNSIRLYLNIYES